MNTHTRRTQRLTTIIAAAAASFLFGCAADAPERPAATPRSLDARVVLGGNQEVPAVSTAASGYGTISVRADQTVHGTIKTSGVTATAAHIHEAAIGVNGPVIIPLNKISDNEWTVPVGAKLTDAQYAAYKAGNLYVNVHSAANKGGEIRGQMRP
jgi:hypothetical protein